MFNGDVFFEIYKNNHPSRVWRGDVVVLITSGM